MELPIFQVDAFSSRTFAGNPAAVCPLPEWLDTSVMQAIAAENNLAETAFFVPRGARYDLRWFTPTVEVDLCGHATLGSAYVLYEYLGAPGGDLMFDTRSGELRVSRADGKLRLDFPSRPAQRCDPHPRLIEALGTQPLEILKASYYLVVYAAEDDVRTPAAQHSAVGIARQHAGDCHCARRRSRFRVSLLRAFLRY